MARDYKRRAGTTRRRQRGPLPGWLWLLTGLGIGLGVAYLVHAHHTGALPGGAVASPANGDPASRRSSGETPSPGAAPAAPRKTRFEFYSLLPEMEVVVTEPEVARRSRAEAPTKAEEPQEAQSRTGSERYVLQAGAFRRLEDADRLRATLALAGLEATIQTVAVDGQDTWHRVRLGPYFDLAAVSAARGRLRAASVEPIVLKIKT